MRGFGNRDFGKTGPPQLRPVFPAIKAERQSERENWRRKGNRRTSKRERMDERNKQKEDEWQ